MAKEGCRNMSHNDMLPGINIDVDQNTSPKTLRFNTETKHKVGTKHQQVGCVSGAAGCSAGVAVTIKRKLCGGGGIKGGRRRIFVFQVFSPSSQNPCRKCKNVGKCRK